MQRCSVLSHCLAREHDTLYCHWRADSLAHIGCDWSVWRAIKAASLGRAAEAAALGQAAKAAALGHATEAAALGHAAEATALGRAAEAAALGRAAEAAALVRAAEAAALGRAAEAAALGRTAQAARGRAPGAICARTGKSSPLACDVSTRPTLISFSHPVARLSVSYCP